LISSVPTCAQPGDFEVKIREYAILNSDFDISSNYRTLNVNIPIGMSLGVVNPTTLISTKVELIDQPNYTNPIVKDLNFVYLNVGVEGDNIIIPTEETNILCPLVSPSTNEYISASDIIVNSYGNLIYSAFDGASKRSKISEINLSTGQIVNSVYTSSDTGRRFDGVFQDGESIWIINGKDTSLNQVYQITLDGENINYEVFHESFGDLVGRFRGAASNSIPNSNSYPGKCLSML
jgi:hypothetical protein